MILDSFAAPGERVAICGAGPHVESELRRACGLRGPGAPGPVPTEIAYCGYDFRTYGWMPIGNAVAFFGRLAPLNDRLLSEYLEIAGLELTHDTQRMKTAYQRAFVLALMASLEPGIVLVERGEQFDEARPAALLREVVTRAPRAVVTYAQDAVHDGLYTRTLDRRPADAAL